MNSKSKSVSKVKPSQQAHLAVITALDPFQTQQHVALSDVAGHIDMHEVKQAA